jgi:hypothetical protein
MMISLRLIFLPEAILAYRNDLSPPSLLAGI